MRQALYQLIADVACAKIREDQYICLAGYLAARRFNLRYFRHKRRIQLQFSVYAKVRALLFRHTGCVIHLVRIRMARTTLCREGKHRHLRFHLAQIFRCLCAGKCNFCQLFRVGSNIDAAVGKDKGAIVAHGLVRYRYHKKRRHCLNPFFVAYDLQSRAQHIAAGMASACYHAIYITAAQHHAAKHQRVADYFLCARTHHTLILLDLLLDGVGIAKQDDIRYPFLHSHAGCLYHTRIVPFRQNDQPLTLFGTLNRSF